MSSGKGSSSGGHFWTQKVPEAHKDGFAWGRAAEKQAQETKLAEKYLEGKHAGEQVMCKYMEKVE